MKKRNNVLRWIILAVIFSWAVYALVPSYNVFMGDNNEIENIKIKAKIQDLEKKLQAAEHLTVAEKKLYDKYSKDENYQTLTEEEIEKLNKFEKEKQKSLSLGLDLQGGMHLVLEIDYHEMLKKLSKLKTKKVEDLLTEVDTKVGNNKETYFSVLKNVFEANQMNLNACFGKPGQSNEKIVASLDSTAKKGVTTTLEVLRNRIDQFGIAEPSIQKRGNHRIIVELPGVSDEERAVKLVNQAAFLEFKIVADITDFNKKVDMINLIVKKKMNMGDLTSEKTEEKAEVKTEEKKEVKKDKEDATKLFSDGEKAEGDSSKTEAVTEDELNKTHPFTSMIKRVYTNEAAVKESDRLKVEEILSYDEVREALGKFEFVWKSKPIVQGEEKYYELFLVKKKAELDGTAIEEATASLASSEQSATGGWEVSMALNRIGARRFADVTGRNVKKRLAIILDGKLYTAPNIQDRIAGGRAQITGNFTAQGARDLAIVLKAGALEAPLEVMEKRVIGPSLGGDSIKSGLYASIAGIALVMLFMMAFYKLSGVFSVIALLSNMLFLMATLAYFKGTLTLPGIAGIILTIGMAVDANVLIFERIKEELRDKKTIYSAVNAGYERAFNTIFDANITTLIAGVVLYQFGTGPIKGFALTLMIGIFWSMVTAIVLTRLLTDIFVNKKSKKISI